MTDLRIEKVQGDALIEDWRHVHNLIIPADPLSLDDVRERVGRNHLEVAYLGDTLVGCTTVRPPADDTATATVIARVLPDHRRQGFGEVLYRHGLEHARTLDAAVIETVILASNVAGVRFAEKHGFVEVERYVLPEDPALWFTMRLTEDGLT
ncbi:GNAT family N-acetyltransferase [Streptomyces sp. NPDC058293]|uniref:GNAT family N-acetyltransferase n=1 Tax=Streptomyces sp. NBC_00119 TaxID=2975659 RepID=A0AAU1UHE5_9ACTN|nr:MULTISPECIES: GNAT family N-acetyltransferase [unclassified Streptomyces]MCX4647774.1 GNAT family N-acetyltransferase [Streptomyces sp. NBC_01446]MCX5320352.1 GNAT family N-acetyltransferase [Streptomyces sp. NBC_00120]